MLLNLLNCCQSFVSTLVLILGIHGLSRWIKNPSWEFFMKEKNCIPRGLKAPESWSLQGRRAYNSSLSAVEVPGAAGRRGWGLSLVNAATWPLLPLHFHSPAAEPVLGNSRGDRKAHPRSQCPRQQSQRPGQQEDTKPLEAKEAVKPTEATPLTEMVDGAMYRLKTRGSRVGEAKIFCCNDTYWNTAERPLLKRRIR